MVLPGVGVKETGSTGWLGGDRGTGGKITGSSQQKIWDDIVMKLLNKIMLVLLAIYQTTSFMRTPCCRFYPSCSNYLAISLERHGFFKGIWLGMLRLLRCHPFGPHGIDEVPGGYAARRRAANVAGRSRALESGASEG